MAVCGRAYTRVRRRQQRITAGRNAVLDSSALKTLWCAVQYAHGHLKKKRLTSQGWVRRRIKHTCAPAHRQKLVCTKNRYYTIHTLQTYTRDRHTDQRPSRWSVGRHIFRVQFNSGRRYTFRVTTKKSY